MGSADEGAVGQTTWKTAFQVTKSSVPHRDNDDDDTSHLPESESRDRAQNQTMARQNPNIVITGTPGVGKTTHAEQLARATGFQHISVNQIVKDEGFHEGKDEETGSWIVDEDKVGSFIFPFLLLQVPCINSNILPLSCLVL
ncbi:predicted protein [Plenodomus lingam JN3]|uniref:Predicted protein n=1 Tax=Leptosphaeria maculans (strain JN3 / isolate v23.1.3 / race Av1-4-5-6-7-8) TaxID=985895 RepID=E5ABL0_LEPMJ|nr:predicted protein [Plenodomus lingam JN3]CBY01051.1 predicted protein [Plenodomus lingam JN3]